MKHSTLALVAFAALALATSSQAQLTWDWSFIGINYNNVVLVGSGTLITSDLEPNPDRYDIA